MVLATLWFAGSGHLLRPAVPAVATLFGLFLYLRRPILYVQYALWVWFLAPLVRRIVDLRFGWMESNVVLLAPLLVSGIAGLTLLRKRGQVAGGIPAAFVLCGTAILYGLVVGAFLRPSAETAYSFLNWLCPLLFGLHLYMNWPEYRQYTRGDQPKLSVGSPDHWSLRCLSVSCALRRGTAIGSKIFVSARRDRVLEHPNP